MTLKYTTLDNINRRLHGRSQIGGNVSVLGGNSITSDLVLQIGEQIEGEMDAILRVRYQLPLKNEQPFLAGIVEAGVICQIHRQYYVAETPAAEGPSDINICIDYRRMLKTLKTAVLPDEELIQPAAQNQPFLYGNSFSGSRDAPSESVEW